MKISLTTIGRGVVFLTVIFILSLLLILLPEIAREERAGNPEVGPQWPFFMGAWILAAPIFIALQQALKLLSYIDNNEMFAPKAEKALQKIKICALSFGLLIVLSGTSLVLWVRYTAPTEDTPPVLLFTTVLTFIAIVFATFIGVLQKLIQNAIEIKSENDLIV